VGRAVPMMTRSLTSITAALTLMLALAPSTAATHAHRPRQVMVASPLHGRSSSRRVIAQAVKLSGKRVDEQA
jgi:hypothetical protein